MQAFIKNRAAIGVFTDGENNSGPAPVIAAIVNATLKGIRVHYGFLNPFAFPKPTWNRPLPIIFGGDPLHPRRSKRQSQRAEASMEPSVMQIQLKPSSIRSSARV